MRAIALAVALGSVLTVEQRDAHRSSLDPPSAAVSADGRYIAFTTTSQLAPADRDRRRDVYVLDRLAHRVTLESAPLAGYPSSDSAHPAISGDGRFLVYETAGWIVLQDRRNGWTRVIAEGRQPAISLDGRTAAFTSDASAHVFLCDVQTGTLSRIGERGGVSPSLSADGRYVAFSAKRSVFIHDRELNTTDRVAAGWDPAISADGRMVAYVAPIATLSNILLFDRVTGQAQVISTGKRGRRANGDSANPAVSADGRIVVFQSDASNLVDRDDFNLLWDVFLFDRETRVMIRVSGDPDAYWMEPSAGPALDQAGRTVAFSSRHPTDASDKQNDFDLFVVRIDETID